MRGGGKQERPLTRPDVLRLIQDHGGPQGLDLSGRNLREADLSNLDLHGIILTSAHLQACSLTGSQLQQANLQKAYPWGANLSAASFTALGYGSWASQPSVWAKGIGAAEAVIGVFMMALFLVTFTRKMVR